MPSQCITALPPNYNRAPNLYGPGTVPRTRMGKQGIKVVIKLGWMSLAVDTSSHCSSANSAAPCLGLCWATVPVLPP